MLPLTQGANNLKLGPGITTESRPTGSTCPASCPMRQVCYSGRLVLRRENIGSGMLERSIEWESNRKGWIAHRSVMWRKEAQDGKLLRLLVNGDLLLPDGSGRIDWDWCQDVCTAAKASGIKGWGYTHAWRTLGAHGASLFREAGIVMYASIHSPQDARDAHAMGFPLALVRGTSWVGKLDDFSFAPCAHQTRGTQCTDCNSCRKGRNVQFLPH